MPRPALGSGLVERIHARRAKRLVVPPKDPTPDFEIFVLNARAIAWSPKLADAAEAVLDAPNFRSYPVVIERSCWAQCPCFDGAVASTATPISSSPRRVQMVRAPPRTIPWSPATVRRTCPPLKVEDPLVRPEDVVAFTCRDQEEYGTQPLSEELKAVDLPAVRWMDIDAAAREAFDHLTRDELDGFFVHLDADWPDGTSSCRFLIQGSSRADIRPPTLIGAACPAIWPAQHLLQPLGSIAEGNGRWRGLWLSTHLQCESVRPSRAPSCGWFEIGSRFAPRCVTRFNPPARNYSHSTSTRSYWLCRSSLAWIVSSPRTGH